MPIYVYECPDGHRREEFFRMADRPEKFVCPVCRKAAKLFPTFGGIETDSPRWLNDEVRGTLQDADLVRQGKLKPIETRKEWREYLKRNGLECVG